MDDSSAMRRNVKRVVYLMLENRSFDNLLGWLYDGDQAPRVHNVPDPNPSIKFKGLTEELLQTFQQPLRHYKGTVDRYPLVKGVTRVNTPQIDPQESFVPVTAQLFGNQDKPPQVSRDQEPGLLGFLENYSEIKGNFDPTWFQMLKTYDRQQACVINTLARSFGVSDEWFSSVPSQTSTNRAFSVCGNSIGYLNKGNRATTAMVDNHYYSNAPTYTPAQFSTKTIWELLNGAGRDKKDDWRVYYSNVWPPKVGTTSYTYQLFPGLQRALESARSPQDKMYQKIDSFYDDVKRGDLPKFSYLEPDYSLAIYGNVGYLGNDYHPPVNITPGEELIAKIYSALAASSLWSETLLVINFDEHGGIFDHVPPPWGAIDPAHADSYEADFKFDRFGVRVPAIFVSPWIPASTVVRSGGRTPFDHTSFLATLIDWWGGMDKSELGARVAAAPTFEAVISDTLRTDKPAMPAPWDGK